MDLRFRLASVIAVRVIVGTVLLGSATLIEINRPGAFAVNPFFFLIALTYALSVVYLATLRWVERRPWIVDLQFGVDAVLVSAFIAITGGVTSYFSSLYVLPIAAASTVRFRRGAMYVALLSALLYLALVSAQYAGAVPVQWIGLAANLPTTRVAEYTVAFNLSGFLAAALLAGSLAEGARSAGARLADASSAIEDLRAFNDYVINSLLSGLATTDGACRILTFNRAAAGITGVPMREAIGADARDALQLSDACRAQLRRIDTARGLRIDLQYRRGDGRMIELGMTASPLVLPDGRDGYLFTFQDVTTMRRLERESRLRQRLAAVGEMAAGIAHEIRNPLAAMAGSIQVLREELPLTEDQAQLMDIVLRESDRLNNTIRSFLAYAKPQRVAASRLDVAAIVNDAATLLRNSADVSATHVIDVHVPSVPVWYDADENQLRQIVWNLATNGLRAMANGGTLGLSVRVDHESEPSAVVLAVGDEGCGIPADQLDHIFQPFHSSFRTGTGLGLAIVHRIVSDHGGVIQVSSSVGVGTMIEVRLPIEQTIVAEQEVA